MAMPDVKQLGKIIDLCRKKGVKSIKIDNVELTLSEEAPIATKRGKSIPEPTVQSEAFETDSLSEEALMFWSTGSNIGDETQ